jgi:centromere protein C
MEIPPGGYKLKKNSRKMTMAFFMHTGKVDVMVADTEFAISKGGIWHVPRGMFAFLLPFISF